MKKNNCATLIVSIAICSLLGVGGCEIPSAKYEMTVNMSASLAAGSSFAAQTHNGAAICEQISGDAWLSTHNGGINVSYTDNAPEVCETILHTYNGNIDLKTPPNVSAIVNLSTYNGSINTELPITLIGTVSKNQLNGKIGDGQGNIKLETYNGSIKIR